MSSLRGLQQPDLSRKLYKLIKAENHAISAYDTAGRERTAIATQLSEWGESTGDDAISDISDKLGVLLNEIAEQEDLFAQGLEEYRTVLKQIRNTESSVQPARDHRAKISDELQKLKFKDGTSTKIPQLEQELVRAEAQSLVAEAQLTNITRAKFKEAYLIHTSALLERCEKQAIFARHARRILALLDDTPIVPGEEHKPFEGSEQARYILHEAEEELRAWRPDWDYEKDVREEDRTTSGLGRGEAGLEAQMDKLDLAETGEAPVAEGSVSEATHIGRGGDNAWSQA